MLNKDALSKLLDRVKECLEKQERGSYIRLEQEINKTSLGEYTLHVAHTGWKTLTIRYFDPGD